MLKVPSKSAFALALAGSLTLTGYQSTNLQSKETKASSTYDLSLAHYVEASPELADKAKELGKDLSKVDPAEKVANNKGTKFEQAAKPYGEYNGVKAPTDSTMQNIYKESSYGKVKLVKKDNTDLVWVELPKGASYYLDLEGKYAENGTYKNGNVNGDAHNGELVTDLFKAADSVVDYSKYAVDGEVPNVFIVHDGTVVTHYGLSVLQADGKYELEKNVNRGNAGDFFKTGSNLTPVSGNVLLLLERQQLNASRFWNSCHRYH